VTRSRSRAAVTHGYTLLICLAPGCNTAVSGRTREVLRECVRKSSGGVLVVTGCTLSPVVCRLRCSGPMILVQPCDGERQPTAPAIRIGPIRADPDIAAVQGWLSAADLRPELLPARLRRPHENARAAIAN
jgi:hypothetical protein